MKKGWTYKKLGEVCRINSGKSIKAELIHSERLDNDFPCYGGNGLRGYVGSPNCPGGNPIVGRVGAQCGNVHYCKEPFYATEHALVVTILSKDVNPLWLCYLLKTMNLKQYAEGAAQPVIAGGKLKNLDFILPPLTEQKRIVERLDVAFAQIDELKANAEKQLAEARALFQKSLAKAMEPKEEWEEKKLGDIAKICLGLTHTPKYTESGVHFISVKDISNGELNLEDTKFISKEEYDSMPSGAKPQRGDLLFCRVGTIGKPQILKIDIPFGIFVSVGFLRIKNETLTEYVKYWMDSPLFYKQVDENVQGSTLKNLNTGWLKNFIVPIPPKNKIKCIVERLDSISENVRKYEEIQRKIIAECDALKQALLRQVFE